MDLDLSNTKDKESNNKGNFFESFVKELKNSLNKNQNLVIDRFEENIAVCENQDNGKMVNISKELISGNATEGMAIKLENGNYIVDYENCMLTRKNIIEKVKNFWEKEEGAEYYFVTAVLNNAVKCSNIFMKQNIYIKDEELIKTMKKGDIVKLVDEKYIIDTEKNSEINEEIGKLKEE